MLRPKVGGRAGDLAGVLLCILACSSGRAANDVWPRPEIVPVPARIRGVANPVFGLAGKWKFTMNPPPEFWRNSVNPASWADVDVPGELVAQNFKISRDVEYPYKRVVLIPADFAGKRIILRFDGVYSYARVWVNGNFVREHNGGFTSWESDITQYVTPGQRAWITVGVTDRADDISYGSNYAKHYIGGILREVKLIALPEEALMRFQVETDFDSAFTDASLKVSVAMAFKKRENATVKLRLNDPQGKPLPLKIDEISLSVARPESTAEIPIAAPQSWDAEHPNLYTLEAVVFTEGTEEEFLAKKVGFRKVERRGNKLYVNGKEVKLRGVCRHDIDPLRGRLTNPTLDDRDVVVLRDANVNFIRTSHYPPTEAFLEACDRYGMYVEEETAVCFVDATWNVSRMASENDPNFTARYLNQFAEMIERDRSHPSVILWSLGNESQWGTNIAREYAYAKNEDRTRPVIFSYPKTVPQGTDGYDIWSEHYPDVDGDLKSAEFPKLNDEFAHVACYNAATLQRDPGVRDFWGESIKRFWENCFNSSGCLGGAIWGGIDEVFMLPESPVGYGEWGIIDGWRRRKPEYWLTKKAYSPIRIADQPVNNPGAGKPLVIPIQNWFDHTNLGELNIEWSAGADSGRITSLNVPPHAQGALTIPGRQWRDGEILKLKFLRLSDLLVDEYNLPVGNLRKTAAAPQGPAPQIKEDANTITVAGQDFKIVFSRATGLITEGSYEGRTILEGGPYLNLGAKSLPTWWLTDLSHSSTPEEAVMRVTGRYLAVRGSEDHGDAKFEIRIDGRGLITTTYSIGNSIKEGSEVGVAFLLSSRVDRLAWEKKCLWSVYPADHIGRPNGVARKDGSREPENYREVPHGSWANDLKDFFLFGSGDPDGRGSNDFRSLKSNIWWAACLLAGSKSGLRVEADGKTGVRAEIQGDGKIRLSIDNLWSYPDLGWGNHLKTISLERGYANTVRMRLVCPNR
jgi:hypothetical protein